MKHPFFEQFKDNNLPWPWEGEPEKFKVQFNKALKQVVINNLVWGPLVGAVLFDVMGLTFKYSLADLPSL